MAGGKAKGASYETAVWYAKQLAKENVEIRNRDQIKKNKDAEEDE